MKPVGVVRFLGSNCDFDVLSAVESLKMPAKFVWSADHVEVSDYSGFVLPGGFSYGDYLRCGAVAARTPAMEDIRKASAKGYPIIGICNGFQILCESGLLPGALLKNDSLRFQDEWVELIKKDSCLFSPKSVNAIKLPIAHGMGRYFATTEQLKALRDKGQVWLEYSINPNGSLQNIAGVCSENKRTAGLMPHPERAMEEWMGGSDGRMLLSGFLEGAL